MIVNDVFTKRQTMITYRLEELLHMLKEERLVLREVNVVQARKIRKYLFDNIEKNQVYLPPIVAHVGEASFEEGKPTHLSIIDGTQRIKAIAQLEGEIIKMTGSDDAKEQRKGFTMHYLLPQIELAVQVFEGITEEEADQMFIDQNTKGKKVALSKRIAYDSRNSINTMTKQILHRNELLEKAGIEQEKHAVMRPRNRNLLSLSQLRGLVGMFSLGRPIKSQAAYGVISEQQMEESVALMDVWFDELFRFHPVESIGNYEVSMLASFPLLTAVATYALEDMEALSFQEKKSEIIQRMRRLQEVDWTRDNDIWRQFHGAERGKDKYYYLYDNKKNMEKLVDWLRRKGGE